MNKVVNAVVAGLLVAGTGQAAMVAEWKFDDAGGSNAVDSVSANDGSITNAAWVAGVEGTALDFSGAGNVEIPAAAFSTVSNEVTLSMWIYGDDAQPLKDAVFCANDSYGVRLVQAILPWNSGTVYFDAGNDHDGDAAVSSAIDRIQYAASTSEYEGKWNHWVFTKNANDGSMVIYVNGAAVSTLASGKTRTMNGVVKAFIGSQDGANYYTGTIDEVQLYDTALSAQEVLDLYDSYTVPNARPIADAQMVTTMKNEAVAITLTGDDPEESPLTYSVVGDVENGVLSGTAPDLTYTPDTDFYGTDSFTFVVNDGETNSPAATVTIRVFDESELWTAVEAPQADGVLSEGLFNTEGTCVYAENTGGEELVFDGITFQAATNASQTVMDSDAFWYGTHPAGQISSTYCFAETNQQPVLKNLNIGQEYRVQALFFDYRDAQSGSHIIVDDQDLGPYANGSTGSGILASFDFVATDTNYTFKIRRTTNDGETVWKQIQLNALALFAIGENVGEYNTWTYGYGLSGDDALETADVDQDGLDNLMEFALGGNPTNNDAAAVAPLSYFGEEAESNYFYHVSNRNTDEALTYTVGAMSDLMFGDPDADDVTLVGQSAESNGFITVTNRTGMSTDTKFISLKVTR